jgi:hypothetical protein
MIYKKEETLLPPLKSSYGKPPLIDLVRSD